MAIPETCCDATRAHVTFRRVALAASKFSHVSDEIRVFRSFTINQLCTRLDTMRYQDAAQEIASNATGIYLVYPTSHESKPIYRGYKTLVDCHHTKVGITKNSFAARDFQYRRTFHSEVAFFALLTVAPEQLAKLERLLLGELKTRYAKSGRAREWFRTIERQAIAQLVWSIYADA